MKYTVIKPQENCGMCGYLWQTIRGIYHNPNKNYYIDFENSIYKSSNVLHGKTDNIWDHFFKQPYCEEKPIASDIEKEVGIIFDNESEFVWSEIKPNTKEEIQRKRYKFNEIIKKYFILREEMQDKIEDFYNKNFKDKRVLGVHFRGTDHPHKKPMDQYMTLVKEKLVNYDVLFVCTDEYERYRLSQIVFPNKFISYGSIKSKNNNIPLHSDISMHPPQYGVRNNLDEYQRKIAEDVIIEAYLMSRVNFLMCCPDSNVNFLARAINPELESVSL